jgi:hypothetical protein
MSDCPYTRAEWDRLTDQQREVLQRIAANRGLDPIPDEPQDPAQPDAAIHEAFNLFGPCNGRCIPEDEIGDDLLLDVRHKFSAVYYVAKELAEEQLRREGFWADSPALGMRLVIDASYDDETNLVVVDWRPEQPPSCYLQESCKAWHFAFETLAALSDEVVRIRDILISRVRELIVPRHAKPVGFDVEYLIRSGTTNEIVATDRVVMTAHDEAEARQRAIDWAHSNDYRCDDRIDPRVETLSVEEVENEADDEVTEGPEVPKPKRGEESPSAPFVLAMRARERGDLLQAAVWDLISTVEATGGVLEDPHGNIFPHADHDWLDLGEAYLAACQALGREPHVERFDEDPEDTAA